MNIIQDINKVTHIHTHIDRLFNINTNDLTDCIYHSDIFLYFADAENFKSINCLIA